MSAKVYRPGIAPAGVLRYPKIDEPDTKGQYADGKYKTEVVFAADDLAAMKKLVNDAAKELLPDLKQPHLPIRTDKKDGTVSIMFKSAKKPLICDSKRQPLPVGTKIRGGTVGRVAYTLTQWEKGISLWLEAIQVVELAESFDISNFGDVTGGYERPEGSVDEAPAVAPADAPTEGGDPFKL